MSIQIGKIVAEFRKSKGLLQKDLARRAGMCAAQLCQIESGRVSPAFQMVERLAAALGTDVPGLLAVTAKVSAEPVREEPVEIAGLNYVPVRATEPDAARALRLVAESERQRDRLAAARHVPLACSVALSRAGAGLDGAGAAFADALRGELGLGTAPIVDLATVLEFRGFRLQNVRLPKQTQSIAYWDATKGAPLVVLNAAMTDERRRFRLAYELASVCLYVSLGCQRLDESLTQHRFLTDFTAAFLMPGITVREAVAATGIAPGDWTFDSLVAMKCRFAVSAEAFALRLEELGLIVPSLRLNLRDRLRAYYIKHPKAMEPQPKDRLAPVLFSIPGEGGGCSSTSGEGFKPYQCAYENKKARRTGQQSQNDFGI